MTIAIDAAWGMGKTTLMRMIQSKFEGKTDKEKQKAPPTRVKHFLFDLIVIGASEIADELSGASSVGH